MGRYESDSVADRLRVLPQYLLPQRVLTRVIHRLTRIRTPWFKDFLIRWFIVRFAVDMSEAAEPDVRRYTDFNSFFTRALREDCRPLAEGEEALCCPVDGAVSQAGIIDKDCLLQAKGCLYSLTQLLGGSEERANPFQDGSFVTLYLSPRDYHRIHMPIRGLLQEMVHIPGKLFSVSPLTTRVIPHLFARNERVVAIFTTAAGPMAVVLVGAVNVASIETTWTGAITPPLGKVIREWRYPQAGPKAIALEKGAELGRFNMGSTVIVVLAKDKVDWNPDLRPANRVRMGQELGRVRAQELSPVDGKGDHF